MINLKKSSIVILLVIPIIANASQTISQSVIFKGFPGNTTYSNSKDLSVSEGGGSAAIVINDEHLLSSSEKITGDFPGDFPPIEPISFDKDKYNVVCNYSGTNSSCTAVFTTIINYGSNKSCSFKVNLKLSTTPDGTTKTHNKSVTGDCSVSGDSLWAVKPT